MRTSARMVRGAVKIQEKGEKRRGMSVLWSSARRTPEKIPTATIASSDDLRQLPAS